MPYRKRVLLINNDLALFALPKKEYSNNFLTCVECFCFRVLCSNFVVFWGKPSARTSLCIVFGMKTSNDLLQLVYSMTSQEKRYFKLSSSFYNKEEGNSAMKLYELVDRLKPETEAELAEAVAGEAYERYLPIVKKQLTELLLNSLVAYHTDKKTDFELRALLSHVGILYDKGLYNHCRKVLARAEKKAIQAEKHLMRMEISYWRRLLLLKNITSSFEEDIHELYREANDALTMVQSSNRYLELMDITQAITVRYAGRPDPQTLDKLRAIVNNPMLQDDAPATSFDAKIAYRNIHGTYSLMTGNNSNALTHYREAVRIWRDHPAVIDERPQQYRRYLINYLTCLVATRNDEEFDTILSTIKALPLPPPDAQLTGIREVWNLELFYYLNNGQLDKGEHVIEEIQRNLHAHGEHLPPLALIPLCYNCSVFYFLKGNYRKSLEFLNMIINESRIELKQDIQEFTRIFSLIAHYELHNIDILENMIRSTQRFLKQRSSAPTLEHTVIRAMRSLLASVDYRSAHEVLRSLYNELVQMLHSSSKEPLGLLEILFWTTGKLRRHPINDVFSEKMQSGTFRNHRDIFPLDHVPGQK